MHSFVHSIPSRGLVKSTLVVPFKAPNGMYRKGSDRCDGRKSVRYGRLIQELALSWNSWLIQFVDALKELLSSLCGPSCQDLLVHEFSMKSHPNLGTSTFYSCDSLLCKVSFILFYVWLITYRTKCFGIKTWLYFFWRKAKMVVPTGFCFLQIFQT